MRNFRPPSAAFGREPLTMEELTRMAPAIFAEHPHESRSEKFTHIPTTDLLAGMAKEGFLPYSVKQGRSRIPGKAAFTKHAIRFRHRSQDQSFKVGDSVHEIVMKNAHDGTSQFHMTSGMFRILCLNGMTAAEGFFHEVKVPHRGDVLGQVVEGAYEVLDNTREITDRVEEFQSRELTASMRSAFANAAHEIRFGDQEHAPTPDQLLAIRRPGDRGTSLWNTLNVVQENCIRGGLTFHRPRQTESGRPMRPIRASTRPVNSVDGDDKINRALWRLTEEMNNILANR